MGECSPISANFDDIAYVTLDNYGFPTVDQDHNHDRGDLHHNWVDEVLR